MTIRAAGYARVSTDEQAREGVSLPTQEERIRAFAAAKGWELVRLYRDEGLSAKSLNRPGVQALLSRLRAKEFDVVVICKLDRLTRSVKDLGTILEAFQKARVALSAIDESLDTSTAAGKLLVNILGSVAQWEREANGERTRHALHHMRERRETYSPTPYGFRREGNKIVIEVKEQRAVALMSRLRAKGLSLRSIARELSGRGILTRGERSWHPNVNAKILRNPLHRGMGANRHPR